MDISTKEGKIKLAIYLGIGVGVIAIAITLKKKLGARGKILRKLGNKKNLTDDKKGNADGKNTQVVFNPSYDAGRLKYAMDGAGTYENIIWETLEPLSKSQREAVRQYFNNYLGEGDSLMTWFEGDLSGSSLRKAKAYFK